MRILLAGATGLIGQAVANRLVLNGHQLLCTARQPVDSWRDDVRWLQIDFAQPPGRDWWLRHLSGVDVVINAVGVFTPAPGQTFDAIHTQAPVELFAAAAQAGVGLVIQVSALGSEENVATDFLASKYRADHALRQMPVRSVVVQPSLVYAPLGPSATLFNQLALLPVVALPMTHAQIQPVHLDDLVEAIAHLVDTPPATSFTMAAVGPQAITLKDYLAALRCALVTHRPQWVLPVPMGLVAAAVRLFSLVLPGMVTASALTMLERGSHGSADVMERTLGRAPRPVTRFLDAQNRSVAREHAQLHTWLGAMKVALALVWVVTGLLSLGLYPKDQSLALLADFGLQGMLAQLALYAGAVIDIVLGLALVLASPRWQMRVLGAQLAVMLGYTALITLRIPEWWLHPFGPILKNLPMLVATGMLMALTRRHN